MFGVELGVQEVLEVGQAVLRRHLEQVLRVLAVPREIGGDVVGRDREGEDPALGIALGHHLDIGTIDQVHLGLEIAVGEGLLHARDHRHLFAQILGQTQSKVRLVKGVWQPQRDGTFRL